MPDSEKDIILDQTLHGYSDGHQLLACSRSFSSEIEWTMLVLSDMSGPSMSKGFESYLTGYPLDDAKFYAIARTWYAPEMKRPGCVWTHTLLINYSDFGQIKDFSFILDLFTRPAKDSISYENPITIPHSAITEICKYQNKFSENFLHRVMAAMYGATKPVFIAAKQADQSFDELVLAMLSQQWPRLRRNFCFCTGSLSNRKYKNSLFDFQIIPLKLSGHIKQKVKPGIFIQGNIDRDLDSPLWLNLIYHDIFVKENSRLRRFLRNFGADISNERIIFSYLAKIFLLSESVKKREEPLSELIKTIKESFPEPDKATRLKTSILGGKTGQNKGKFLPLPEHEILRELVTTPYYNAFDADILDICRRSVTFWQSDYAKAYDLMLELFESDENPNLFAESFFAGIAGIIKIKELLLFSKEHPCIFLTLVELKPSLAISPLLWQQPVSLQHDLFEVIVEKRESIEQGIIKQIITAIFQAGSETLAEDVISAFGETAIITILDWFNSFEKGAAKELSQTLLRTLKSYPQTLLNWLSVTVSPGQASVALVAGLLDPHSKLVRKSGTKVWLGFLEKDFSMLDPGRLTRTMAFMLALGFNNIDSGSYKLVRASFPTVYQAAKRNMLDHESWQLLKDQLPTSFFWWQNRNKSKRLKAALKEFENQAF